ncbi:MAG: phosphate ABC transporter permease PstA, partial [Gammaproteobacteria bacterium]|nr:phosphate ABC transporter permease PstA [Gammaproteobacteria bacterium]
MTIATRKPEETRALVIAGLVKRRAAERRFQAYGILGVFLGLLFLGYFFATIFSDGYTAFVQTHVELEIYFDPDLIDPENSNDPKVWAKANYAKLIRAQLAIDFPDVKKRRDKKALRGLISGGAPFILQDKLLADSTLLGTRQTYWLPADDEVDMFYKGNVDRMLDEAKRRFKDNQIAWIDALDEQGRVRTQFNTTFFTSGDSRDPEMAGILGAMKGSFFMLLVTILIAFPLGVAAAIYLEEFAPRNRWIDLLEVNINNLAAVPSIIYGLLGLAVFINFMSLPRSAPLVGGLVLALMTLPIIIIAGRSAIRAVPPSIRQAALGLGASDVQAVFHHVLPLALPGLMTGAIIGMARALGETAPLLMIGMVAFIVEVPGTPFDPSSALPVQIYLWADSPERAFVERTAAAIIVLLSFLL